MIIQVKIDIQQSRTAIWSVITDIDNAANTISGIEKIEILERPKDGFVGLKWRETRTLFGQTATEVMWITESTENECYKTRAESHGAVYLTTLSISDHDTGCVLTMTFDSEPQNIKAKFLSALMGFIFKGPTKKALIQDLKDIKAAVEQK